MSALHWGSRGEGDPRRGGEQKKGGKWAKKKVKTGRSQVDTRPLLIDKKRGKKEKR